MKALFALITPPLAICLVLLHLHAPEMVVELLTLAGVGGGIKWMTSIEREASIDEVRKRRR